MRCSSDFGSESAKFNRQNDYWLSPQKAVEYGMIDYVVR